ncbi:MAG: hypothetical protein HYR56_13935 [Acidobacteria bacterium]|nr:hypothetical protein [Acidobacteriota bacterium]MBI3425263.1 hypothetical protein [Acidobacteriota bacterium]
MNNKRTPFRLCFWLSFCATLLVLLTTVAYADTIKMKDGSVYKGKVTGYSQRKFTITIYVGSSSSQHVIPVDEIESVEFDASDIGAPRAMTNPGNPEGPSSRSEKPRYESQPVQQPIVRPDPEAKEPVAIAKPPVTNTGEINTAALGETAGLLADKTISIAAAADWTSTEVRVQRGQRVVVNASGEVDLGNNQRATPNGIALNDSRKLMLNRPTGALIAVVGDDNDDFVFLGTNGEFTATHSGVLFLSVNEGNLKDNNGSFIAKVKVFNK